MTDQEPTKRENQEAVDTATNALREFRTMIPEKHYAAIALRTQQVIGDYLRHGEGGKLCLLHLSLTVAKMVAEDKL